MHRRFYNGQFRQRAMAFDFLPGSLIRDSMAYLFLSSLKILNSGGSREGGLCMKFCESSLGDREALCGLPNSS